MPHTQAVSNATYTSNTCVIRKNNMHTLILMFLFNYNVFDLFRPSKCSSSGKLHVQVFLRINTWINGELISVRKHNYNCMLDYGIY